MESENLAVITSFPQKGVIHDKVVVGIASYTKNTLLALKKYNPSLKITVFAEILSGKKENYEDNGILVKRVWKRNSFLIFPTLIKNAYSLNKDTKNVLVEFEVAMFGDFFYLLFFPVFLLFLRISGRKTTIVMHQVISDINELSGHINLKSGKKALVLNFFISSFYRTILLLASKAIVFDKVLKDKLSKYTDTKKIIVIPHGVEQFKDDVSRHSAREKLKISSNDFVVLYFGFLAWYKGADWLINAFDAKKAKENGIKLVMAGGGNPNHLNKKYYQDYLENIKIVCKEKGIVLTGFVNEEDIPLYFKAADVVVLPYRTLMSSSGPLSIAFSFGKAFITSNALEEIFDTQDLKELLESKGLSKQDLIFSSFDEFNSLVRKLKTNKEFGGGVEDLSLEIAKKRSWEVIGKRYYEEIFS